MARKPVFVSQGQRIIIATYMLYITIPDIWGADAEDFTPELWEGRKGVEHEFIPFTGGPRKCIRLRFLDLFF